MSAATIAEEQAEEHPRSLHDVWADPPGIPGFLKTVDHKRIGMRYIYTAITFFFIAGAQALVIRGQLAVPNGGLVGPEQYNQLFTMHGVTMIFLFNTPVLAGFGNYLLPLALGTRDMAFPRLNAFSYWIFLFSGLFIYASIFVGAPPDAGWFAYTPLSDPTYSPGLNQDFWALGVIFTGISTTVGSINFIVTTFKMRAPGMTVNRIPVLVWSFVGMGFMVIFAVPSLTVAAGLLEADRLLGTSFYLPSGGGEPLLYQHLFWFWGHPEVYILLLPALGMVSSIIPVASRRPLSGYVWVVTSIVAIAFISFGVWVHHMFATGMPGMAMSFFAAASLIIAIPSGVQFFAWIATMWGGRIRWNAPMLFCLGFFIIFLLGGLTGVMVAVMPFDLQAHDTYFVVAHFHYVLNGAVVFPIFGAIYYWWPKMTGRSLSERLGRWSFWMMFIAFNITFFPMHVLGLMGMPRRVYTYREGLGWDLLNQTASIGGAFFGIGTILTVAAIVRARRRDAPEAGPDPWQADTLEWSVPSPTPHHNFEAIPVVTSRHPLWEPERYEAASGTDDATRALGPEGAWARETPVTGGLAAVPESTMAIPRDTYLPFIVACGIAIGFVGTLVTTALIIVLGAGVAIVALCRWLWHTEADLT